MKVFYFGCVGEPGHYLFTPGFGHTRDTTPFGETPDATLTPHRAGCNKRSYCGCGSRPEGEALLHHKDGWTALSFWDRSVDKRGGCNSNFIAEGIYDFDEMLELARGHFPTVMQRFTFPIKNVTPDSD